MLHAQEALTPHPDAPPSPTQHTGSSTSAASQAAATTSTSPNSAASASQWLCFRCISVCATCTASCESLPCWAAFWNTASTEAARSCLDLWCLARLRGCPWAPYSCFPDTLFTKP